MSKKKKSTNSERLDTLLQQQLKRQFVHHHTRPPNPAAQGLGKQILAEFLESGADKNTRECVIEALCEEGLHPSVPHAFFESFSSFIAEHPSRSFDWLPHWLVQIEEVARENKKAAAETLSACIRTYAAYLVRSEHGSKDSELVMKTYSRLKRKASRALLARETISLVTESSLRKVPLVLSPLLAVALLARSCSSTERSVFLQNLWKALWAVWESNIDDDRLLVLAWLTQALRIFLSSFDDGNQEENTELAESWLMELVALAQSIEDDERIAQWMDGILRHTLPRLLTAPGSWSWKPLLHSLIGLSDCLSSRTAVDPALAIQLCTLVVSTPVAAELQALLQLLSGICTSSRLAVSGQTTSRLLTGLTYIYMQDWQEYTITLQERLANCGSGGGGIQSEDEIVLNRLIGKKESRMMDQVVATIDFSGAELSSLQQVGALLLGISQLNDVWYEYLKRLFAQYPHLSVTFLPVMMQHVHAAALRGDGSKLITHLQFLSESLVTDPHSAQQVWNLVGVQWMKPSTSLSVRITMIRQVYPRICASNKRLYRRVIESLGVSVVDKDPEIRLAVSATLADLAKEDCIRDVSDVIGWIQSLLTEGGELPIHSLIVHNAVLSLHYLLLAEELEFDLVIKVLNKRLCSVADTNRLAELPPVVLEALVLLLGDGEIGKDDSEEEQAGMDTVSPQVASSVSALLSLGKNIQRKTNTSYSRATHTIRMKTMRNIFKSLAGYSLEALGVEDEGMKAVIDDYLGEAREGQLPDSGARYQELRDLILRSIEDLIKDERTAPEEPIVKLATRLLAFEEETLGASYWQKRGQQGLMSREAREAHRRTSIALKALPSASKLDQLPSSTPSVARAIGKLLASDGTELKILRDNADNSIETTDPLYTVFTTKAFLHAAQSFLLEKSMGDLETVLKEIRGWYEVFVSPDALHLVLAAFSTCIAADQSSKDTGALTHARLLCGEVMDAFKSHTFQNEDVGKICVGLIGTCRMQCGDTALGFEAIDILEQSVRGYGGQQDFGAFFGVALVGQSAANRTGGLQSCLSLEDSKRTITKVSSFLVEELLSCFEDGGEVFVDLIACLRTGKATPGLVESLESLGSNSIALLMTKQVVARYILISCAFCLPALASIDGNLLLAVFRLIESFEWGAGKGIALAAVLQKCEETNLLPKNEAELVHNEYTSVFERRMEHMDTAVDAEGLDDIFYAVNGMSSTSTPHHIQRFLVGNKELFDDEGCALSLLACVLSVSSMPSLGLSFFTDKFYILPTVTESDVKSVVQMVFRAAISDDNSKFCGVGAILLGALSSLESKPEDHTVTEKSTGHDQSETTGTKSGFDFGKLPRPQLGTLAEGAVDLLESYYTGSKDAERSSCTGAMAALEAISLPGKYAQSFLAKALESTNESLLPAVRLLCSQVRGRRSAIHEGKDFISLAATLNASSHQNKIDLQSDRFSYGFLVDQLPEILPKFSLEVIQQSMTHMWGHCLQLRDKPIEMAAVLIGSFRRLLKSTALAPKALTLIREFVTGQLFLDISALPLHETVSSGNASQTVVDAYTSCVMEVPIATLDVASFFALQGADTGNFSSEAFRALIVLKTLKLNIFSLPSRSEKELSSVTAWIARNFTSSGESKERDSLRRLFNAFSSATCSEHPNKKRERLANVFEILLLTTRETCKLGLEFLSGLLVFWCRGYVTTTSPSLGYLFALNDDAVNSLSIAELEQFFWMAAEDLPTNLATYATNQQINALVSNQLQRLHTHLVSLKAEDRQIKIVEKCFFMCHEGKEESFVSLAARSLQTF